ncbi:MAG: hypothetical protein Q7K71_03265 [Candidatus Omnitrophota bacterium]|nr:hypothetical protein [Candidatus Omnitrophota bacterium]
MHFILGVDFDNTLVNYDDVFLKTARQMGLIENGAVRHKKNIRDAVRQLPDGETKWQQVQAHVYGKAMDEAVLISGVGRFLKACRSAGLPVYIVSHKTRFAAQDTDRIDLRQAALDWMKQKGFFDFQGFGFSTDQVFFESTRQDKVGRIKQLNCTHFIDDLEETFLEKSFPEQTARILYSSQGEGPRGDMKVLHDWKEIYDHFFSNGR